MSEKSERRKKIRELFFTFLKIGAFTFGGGYAMISLLEDEFIERRGWVTHDEFADMVAIAESTPGPIAINAATFIGYRAAGTAGAVAATAGVCIPSLVIIYLISLFFDAFLSLSVVANAFRGIQVCVVWLILSAGVKMFRGLKKTAFSMAVLALTVALGVLFSALAVNFSSILYILAGGVAGLCAYAIGRIGGGEK